MLLERLDRFEFLLVADPADESDIDRAPVEVAVEIEQEDLQQRRTIIEHRPDPEAGDAVVAHVANADAHRIDAVLEPAGWVEPEIGGGKAELAPALVAVDHVPRDEPRRAEELGRLHYFALQ